MILGAAEPWLGQAPRIAIWVLPIVAVGCAIAYSAKPTIGRVRLAVSALAVMGIGFAVLYAWALMPYVDEEHSMFVSAAIHYAIEMGVLAIVWIIVWSVPMFMGRRRRLRR